jgi:hypothetical protein
MLAGACITCLRDGLGSVTKSWSSWKMFCSKRSKTEPPLKEDLKEVFPLLRLHSFVRAAVPASPTVSQTFVTSAVDEC